MRPYYGFLNYQWLVSYVHIVLFCEVIVFFSRDPSIINILVMTILFFVGYKK